VQLSGFEPGFLQHHWEFAMGPSSLSLEENKFKNSKPFKSHKDKGFARTSEPCCIIHIVEYSYRGCTVHCYMFHSEDNTQHLCELPPIRWNLISAPALPTINRTKNINRDRENLHPCEKITNDENTNLFCPIYVMIWVGIGLTTERTAQRFKSEQWHKVKKKEFWLCYVSINVCHCHRIFST
jgi:hypothetical protein